MTKREFLQQLKPKTLIKIEVKGCEGFSQVRFVEFRDDNLYYITLENEQELKQEHEDWFDDSVEDMWEYWWTGIPIEHVRKVGLADEMLRVLYE